MAKASRNTTPFEPPSVTHKCEECGREGLVGRDIGAYSFKLKDVRWFCRIGLRDCQAKAYEKYKAER